MIRARTIAAFLLGWFLARWSVFRMDIDEYHRIRMDFETALADLNEVLDE